MSNALDRADIRDALERYIWSIDTHEADTFVENFVIDGVYESPFGTATGHPEIRAVIEQWHGSGITAGKRHLSGPAVINVEGDTAHVQASYVILEAAETPGVVASGAYVDRWIREGDTWKIAHRSQTIDPSFKMPQ